MHVHPLLLSPHLLPTPLIVRGKGGGSCTYPFPAFPPNPLLPTPLEVRVEGGGAVGGQMICCRQVVLVHYVCYHSAKRDAIKSCQLVEKII